ncbi:hypothetical protein PGT21_003475 [Puccinia graminis f. sp. tritici]|uniref:Uncharacterized protein n=1 Tax=Puccinia graminis f. sp. tritici TaxID=56615 RepID=A0A5B0P3C0_PUCGR|nr:hypothetical protein PGT21_003475 [Puccinia graminis f. sp. tritici]KAA1137153.1 hypothetical protein PGTUg99_005477 [Puccinia graminis f. sp. tritici]
MWARNFKEIEWLGGGGKEDEEVDHVCLVEGLEHLCLVDLKTDDSFQVDLKTGVGFQVGLKTNAGSQVSLKTDAGSQVGMKTSFGSQVDLKSSFVFQVGWKTMSGKVFWVPTLKWSSSRLQNPKWF